MTERQIARRKAIIRRRIFLSVSAALLALLVALIVFVVISVVKTDKDKEKLPTESGSSETASSTETSSTEDSSKDTLSKQETQTSEKPTEVTMGEFKLDAKYTNLLLVNGENPLPDDYDANVRADLVEIDPKYRNNNYVTQIHKDVYPYVVAMVSNAQKEGVDLRVWSPFRSYAIQNDLFQKQVNRVGGDEELAATVVARPGTSEHNTGLCADFNMASDAFEKTEMYAWMKENAEDYGFVMRYSAEKQSITGVIHESWHWRFVGINAAHEMNELGMCLEEYVEYKNNGKRNTTK